MIPEILDEDLIENREIDQFKLKKQIRILSNIAVVLALFIFILIEKSENSLAVTIGLLFIIAPIITLITSLIFNFIPYRSFSYKKRLPRIFLIILNIFYSFILLLVIVDLLGLTPLF